MPSNPNYDWEAYERRRPKVSIRMSAHERRLLQLVLIQRNESITEFFMTYARPYLERIEREGDDIPRDKKPRRR